MNINLKNNFLITILISLGILTFLYFFFANDSFFQWAFARHQNTLSWAIRPLLLLPFCYFAYKKSLNGILLTILGIFTSMFWFPVPAEVNSQVADFLNMEKEYLTSGFNATKAVFNITIVAFFVFLARAFWKKSIKIGIGIAVSAAILKSFWSVVMSPDGGTTVIPFAMGGFLILCVAVLIYRKFNK